MCIFVGHKNKRIFSPKGGGMLWLTSERMKADASKAQLTSERTKADASKRQITSERLKLATGVVDPPRAEGMSEVSDSRSNKIYL